MDWLLLIVVGMIVGIHLERWRRRREDRAAEKSLDSLNAFAANFKGVGATVREAIAKEEQKRP